MYHIVSKHNSGHHVLFCHDALLHLAVDSSSCMKVVNESLRLICRYEENACVAVLLSFRYLSLIFYKLAGVDKTKYKKEYNGAPHH